MRLFLKIILIFLIIALSYFILTVVQSTLVDDNNDEEVLNQDDLDDNQDITPIQNGQQQAVRQSLTTNSGRELVVNKFSQVQGVTDVGSDMYHLSTDTYDIIFNESNSSFAINIARKPVTTTRDTAVQELALLLGVSTFELCDLNIYVGTTKEFDPATAARNLGIGVCAN